TGRSKPLDIRSLKKGEGIQVALYGMLIHALGVTDVTAGYVIPEHPFTSDQLTLQTINGEQKIWRTLADMQDTGVFGMRRVVRAEYVRALPLPLATLHIPEETLQLKWELTHSTDE
ncbi:MAG: hypothetical protein ABIP97_07960, partial [Chthoniobacterales bacterium]